jgi:hypothetical protein
MFAISPRDMVDPSAPGTESVPEPHGYSQQIPSRTAPFDFFVAGLHMPPHPVLVDILRKFRVQLHHLTLNAIVHISKFIWAVTSCGIYLTANVFAQHYELHYQNKKIHLEGCETTLFAQFGYITFHPSQYGGQVKITLAVKNKWTSGWDSHWFYCRVSSEELADVWGKGSYPLRSKMTLLDYLVDTPFECSPEVVDVAAFIEATSIIGGRDAVEEILACGIWSLNDSCDFEVETKETPLSKVTMPMLKVTPIIGMKESEAVFEMRIINAHNLLVGNYNVVEHNAYTGLRHG